MKNMLSLEAFADWASKQPAEKEYDYWDSTECAMTRYVRAVGFDTPHVSVTPNGTDNAHFTTRDGRTVHLPAGFEGAAWDRPRTFGSLATRLRKASAP